MKSDGKGQTTTDPSKKDDKSAQGISVKSRGLGCRKSGTSIGKLSKHRRKTSGNDNEHYLQLPPTPLHPQSLAMKSISIPNTPLEVPTLARVQSRLQIQKLQLQLFPMDEPTRKHLEEENHYPYLELTITTKKKIASVIRHLNMKWGNSRSSLEELFLFPYNVRVESLEGYNRWTLKDSDITAAEVHATIGKPAPFRLRYGWLGILELASKEIHKTDEDEQGKEPSTAVTQVCEPWPVEPLLKQDVLGTAPLKTNQAADDDVKLLSWVDCASNMSFGALLSEVEAAEFTKLSGQTPQKQIPISCDSFDAAIAAHIVRYQTGNQSTTMAQPSILDAEETCNPFSFHNLTSLNKNIRVQSQLSHLHGDKLCNVPSPPVDPPNTALTSEVQEENNQVEGLANMHWPPSAGPWQFIASSSSSHQILGSDSNNGLNGFASTSLDIF